MMDFFIIQIIHETPTHTSKVESEKDEIRSSGSVWFYLSLSKKDKEELATVE